MRTVAAVVMAVLLAACATKSFEPSTSAQVLGIQTEEQRDAYLADYRKKVEALGPQPHFPDGQLRELTPAEIEHRVNIMRYSLEKHPPLPSEKGISGRGPTLVCYPSGTTTVCY